MLEPGSRRCRRRSRDTRANTRPGADPGRVEVDLWSTRHPIIAKKTPQAHEHGDTKMEAEPGGEAKGVPSSSGPGRMKAGHSVIGAPQVMA